MFGSFSEQLKNSSKPVHTLLAVNTKTLESLSEQQTTLITGLLSDSVRYLEAVAKQTEFKGVMNANSELAESVRERMTSASKDAYSTMNAMRGEVAEIMSVSLSTATEGAKKTAEEVTKPVTKATQKATKKTTEAAKETVKESAKATSETAKKTVSKAEESTAKAATTLTKTADAAEPAKKPATRTRRTPAKKTTTAKTAATKSTN